MIMEKPKWSRYLTYGVFALLYLPVVVLIITSFNASRFGGSWGGFTVSWYTRLFHEPSIWHALINSLLVATYSSLTSTVLGLTAALALYRYRSPLQRMHLGLLLAPLVMPDILMGISLLFLFVSIHLKLSLLTVFLAHTTFSISYVAMIVRTRLETMDRTVIEAAKDLGATSFQVFWKVLLPILAPAIIAGGLLAFTLSLDDFVITFFVVGPGATTLPVYVYSMMKFGSPPLINALSTLLLLFTGIVTVVYARLADEVAP
jgi:spermidine/putrescine transport system permease protein